MTSVSMLRRAVRRLRARVAPVMADAERARVEMTCCCRDAEAVPKVAGAGAVFRRHGRPVQRMHQGVLVPAGGYHGAWMSEIIRRLRGHHEPQEERLVHHLLSHCRPGTRMVEVGAFWAYYSAWYLTAVPGATAVCLEPDANNADVGRETMALNGLSATWVAGAAGRHHVPAVLFRRESDGQARPVPVHSFGSLLGVAGAGPVELLHIDAQGAEVPFLESLADVDVRATVRFVVVSTHDVSISGSTTTHEDCLRIIRRLGGAVLDEHTVEESFSGDGLIVASFDAADVGLVLPAISRNVAAASLFGLPSAPGGRVRLADTQQGPMLVRAADRVIGARLLAAGRFEEDQVTEVVRHLRRTREFDAGLYVSIGANIGTDLLWALRGGMFAAGVAIEMDPENFRLLQVNTLLNLPAPHPLLLNVAVGETRGEATMECSPDNFGDHRIRIEHAPIDDRFGEAGRRLVRVPMTTLDAIEQVHGLSFDASTLCWIDTQGFEGHVLAGAASIMARPPERRPAVVLEFWPYGLERTGGRERLFAFLAGCREIRDLGAAAWSDATPLSLADAHALYEQLLHDHTAVTPMHTDLLCLP
jgi:FkbM family methyltransferase